MYWTSTVVVERGARKSRAPSRSQHLPAAARGHQPRAPEDIVPSAFARPPQYSRAAAGITRVGSSHLPPQTLHPLEETCREVLLLVNLKRPSFVGNFLTTFARGVGRLSPATRYRTARASLRRVAVGAVR